MLAIAQHRSVFAQLTAFAQPTAGIGHRCWRLARVSRHLTMILWAVACAGLFNPIPALAGDCPGGALGYMITVQGVVEISSGAGGAWQPAKLDTLVCLGDVVRVGEKSRAGIYFAEVETVAYVDQNTTTRPAERPAERSLVLDLLQGALNFLSREPRSLEVRTPFVNAGVKGTEFEVRVELERPAGERPTEPFSGRTLITLFEGRVEARTAQDTTILVSGQSGEVRGSCPSGLSLELLRGDPTCDVPEGVQAVRVYARLPNAVQWALYYPPIAADGAAGLRPDLVEVSRLLARGRVDAALTILCGEPADGEKSALIAIIELTRNDPVQAQSPTDACGRPSGRDNRRRALDFAAQAVQTSPRSAASWLAHSYAQQAYGKLDGALESLQQGIKVDPRNALLHARLAEIWLSFGYHDKALEAAATAARLAPDLSRTQTVYGFAALAEIDITRARLAFTTAVRLDSADPLPRLGLGLAKIRNGELAAGRSELEIAAGLDPQNSLIRSYLGKAYFEEKRDLDAAQYDIAKALDPNDPTPWLYDAIRLRIENRPVEALHAVQESIERNENRGVYRSQLLLDEDLAARGAQLGRIYRDLGFEQLGLVEGWRSLRSDPDNYSAHRLLADSYTTLPRHQIAADSELLQSQLLQPININPVQPRLADNGLTFLDDIGIGGVGFNEFTRLFARDQVQLQIDGIAGSQDTLADNVILSGIVGKTSFSFGQFHFESDGIRSNNTLNQDILDLYGQLTFDEDTSAQIELRYIDQTSGDRELLFDPTNFSPTQRDTFESGSARVGLRHDLSPQSTIIASYTFADGKDETTDPGIDLSLSVEETTHFFESRYLFQSDRLSLTGGFGLFFGDVDETIAFMPPPVETRESSIEHENAYVYSQINPTENLGFVLGASLDVLEDVAVERTQVNPKVGLIWDITNDTTVRASAFRTLKRTLSSSQTIEPTQVAGFNQFFDDVNGTDAWRFGVALDQRIGDELFAGIELSARELTVPVISLADPETTIDVDQDEKLARAYLYWTPTDRLALSAEYQFERLERDENALNVEALRDVSTHRVPLEIRFFDPSGLFAAARATYVHQEGHFQDSSGVINPGDDSFWIVDASLGYRFDHQRGLVSLEARNLLDEQFQFQDTDPANAIINPDFMILGRLTLAF
jgi:tetratricopeptide (TPR) repeat protein